MRDQSLVVRSRIFLYLLMYAFILIIIPVIRALSCSSCEKFNHFILVKTKVASVCIGVLVIFVKLAALTARLVLMTVFRKIHNSSPFGLLPLFYHRKSKKSIPYAKYNKKRKPLQNPHNRENTEVYFSVRTGCYKARSRIRHA